MILAAALAPDRLEMQAIDSANAAPAAADRVELNPTVVHPRAGGMWRRQLRPPIDSGAPLVQRTISQKQVDEVLVRHSQFTG